MKNAWLFALLLSFGVATPVYAELQSSVKLQQVEPDESQLKSHGHYQNKVGQTVHAPAKSVDNKIPQGASARCRDGSYSFSKKHRGTCSRHGGVATWL